MNSVAATNKSAAETDIRIVRADATHAAAMAEFFRRDWEPNATAEGVLAGRAADAAANPALRGKGESPTYLMLRGGHALGYVSTIPVRVWLAERSEEIDVFWVKGLNVLPEHRSGPIGVLLAKELVRDCPVLLSLTVQMPARRLFKALGFHESGALSTMICILDPVGVLKRIDIEAIGLGSLPRIIGGGVRAVQRLHLAGIAGTTARFGRGVLALWRAPRSRGVRPVLGEDPPPHEIDRLWSDARTGMRAAVVRDAAYFTYRYRGAERGSYSVVTAYRGSALAGVAYVRHPRADDDARLRGMQVATLSDMLFRSGDVAVVAALARGAERTARTLGAHALVSSATIPALDGVLRKRGWLGLPGTFQFATHDGQAPSRFPARLEDWWLTRGDGGSDSGL